MGELIGYRVYGESALSKSSVQNAVYPATKIGLHAAEVCAKRLQAANDAEQKEQGK